VLIAALTLGSPSASYASTRHSATVGSAPAARAASLCAGKSENYIVRKFSRGKEVFPLRCGTTTWGYIHILFREHGYNPSLIALTLARGSLPQPKDQVYVYQISAKNACPIVTYRVVFNQAQLGGTGVGPQGIITAYENQIACK
jgi:hypothetical protein